jgi:hypothetical protein
VEAVNDAVGAHGFIEETAVGVDGHPFLFLGGGVEVAEVVSDVPVVWAMRWTPQQTTHKRKKHTYVGVMTPSMALSTPGTPSLNTLSVLMAEAKKVRQ